MHHRCSRGVPDIAIGRADRNAAELAVTRRISFGDLIESSIVDVFKSGSLVPNGKLLHGFSEEALFICSVSRYVSGDDAIDREAKNGLFHVSSLT